MKKETVLLLIMAIMLLLLATIIIFKIVVDVKCSDVCKREGAITHDVKMSGNLAFDDICICYFDDDIEIHRLGS